MKIAVIRGAALNKWEMQSYEALPEEFEITACGAIANNYPTDSIGIETKFFDLASDRFDRLGAAGRVGTRLGLLKRPEELMIGLEDWLKDFDIVHAAELHMVASLQAVRAARRHGLKSVVTCWETIPFAYEDSHVALRECRETVRAEADLFLATTERAASALRIEGVEDDRIKVVMPGVDTDRFLPAPKPQEFMKRYGVGDEDIVVLTISRLLREKGIRELLIGYRHSLRLLPESIAKRCRLLIAGRGPQLEFIERLIAQLGIADSARIIGSCDYMEIHQLHQIADIFAMTSIHTPYWEEQFGMVLAEAMACGRPVISTRTGGIPDVLGDAGVLVPPLEPEAFGEELAKLLRNPGLRDSLGRSARARAVEHLSSESFSRQLADVYRSLKAPKDAARNSNLVSAPQ